MQPLKAFTLDELRQRKSEKWRGFTHDVLPLPVAEMDFEIAPGIRELLIGMLNNSDTGYLGNVHELGENLSTFMKNRWNWNVDKANVFTATDVGVGMVEMARMVLQPGDGIVINSPVYHNFTNWANELKAKIVDAPLKKDGLTYSLDIEALEVAYRTGAKAHFLCNPQNPTGGYFTREELTAIADLAKQYGVTVFSDEIHAPLTFDSKNFIPFLSINENAREMGICVTAASKSWNIAGLKCATIIVASDRTLALAKAMPLAVHYRASLFGAFAAAKAYESVDWLDSCLDTLDANRKFLKTELEKKLPMVGYRIPDVSYLAWLDVSAMNLGDEPAKIFLEKGKVAFNPGASFSKSHKQFVRLNFGTSQEIISEAVTRMASVL